MDELILNKEDVPEGIKIFGKALQAYDHLCETQNDETPLSNSDDAGNCSVYFKGTIEDIEAVKSLLNVIRLAKSMEEPPKESP